MSVRNWIISDLHSAGCHNPPPEMGPEEALMRRALIWSKLIAGFNFVNVKFDALR